MTPGAAEIKQKKKPLTLGITPKLTLVFVFFAAALLVGGSLFSFRSGREALETAANLELFSTAIAKETALNAWVEDRQREIASFAASPGLLEDVAALVGPDRAAAHNRLVAELRTRVDPEGSYLEFAIIEPETGQVIVSTNPAEEGKFKENLLYFLNGKRAPYVQNPYYSISGQKPVMTASAPLRSTEGRLMGVLAAQMNIDQMNAIIQHRSDLRQSDDAFLVNTSSLFVTQPRLISDPTVLQRGTHTEAVQRCLKGSSGTITTVDYRQIPALIVYRWLADRQMCLIVKMDQAEALAPVHSFGQAIALTGGTVLLVASGLAFVLAQTITVPVKQLAQSAREIGSGKLDTRIEVKSGDEIGQLAEVFAQMATNLQQTLVSRTELLKEVAERQRAEEEVHRLNAELEQRVAQRTKQLESANKELEAFSYSVSHDLRAPLRGIDGWSLALLEDYGNQLDEEGRQYLDRVRFETQRMGQLIDDMLQLSRVSRADMEQGPVDLTAIAYTVAATLQATQPERQMEFVIQPGLMATGDARLLKIVLSNLLSNACKFSSMRPDARIEFSQTEVTGRHAYLVRDNGAGFDMAYASKLFGAFQRLHKASEFPGTGVGLAIVQRIVHRHNGQVWVEAQVNQGATFYFTLEEGT